jgi:hypothetical protein
MIVFEDGITISAGVTFSGSSPEAILMEDTTALLMEDGTEYLME